MATNVKVEVTGVKEALREINSIDKAARRGITTRYKQIMAPVIQRAKSLVPRETPISGFARYWNPRPGRQIATAGNGLLPWVEYNDQRAIEPFVSGKKPSEYAGNIRNLAAFGARWKGPHAVLFDTAGDGTDMGRALHQRYGSPSRVMWRAWEQKDDTIETEIADLIKDIMAMVNQRIKVGA